MYLDASTIWMEEWRESCSGANGSRIAGGTAGMCICIRNKHIDI